MERFLRWGESYEAGIAMKNVRELGPIEMGALRGGKDGRWCWGSRGEDSTDAKEISKTPRKGTVSEVLSRRPTPPPNAKSSNAPQRPRTPEPPNPRTPEPPKFDEAYAILAQSGSDSDGSLVTARPSELLAYLTTPRKSPKSTKTMKITGEGEMEGLAAREGVVGLKESPGETLYEAEE
jgi:hypothetical protein